MSWTPRARREVGVEPPSQSGVEPLRPVDVRHGDGDDLELHVRLADARCRSRVGADLGLTHLGLPRRSPVADHGRAGRHRVAPVEHPGSAPVPGSRGRTRVFAGRDPARPEAIVRITPRRSACVPAAAWAATPTSASSSPVTRPQLPVYVEGAEFSAGDGHMAQGGGEVSGTGARDADVRRRCGSAVIKNTRHQRAARRRPGGRPDPLTCRPTMLDAGVLHHDRDRARTCGERQERRPRDDRLAVVDQQISLHEAYVLLQRRRRSQEGSSTTRSGPRSPLPGRPWSTS